MNLRDKQEWLASLKPGSKVIYTSGHHGAVPEVATVDRLTKKMILLNGISDRFRRDNGDQVGELFYRQAYIEPWTPEAETKAIQRMERRKMLKRITGFCNWVNLPDEDLKKVITIIGAVPK